MIKYSFKCTTYGRVGYLEEALYSFLLLENSDDSEFVIINDYPLQKLIFEHPKVRIINLDKTFPILGNKENFAIENCLGDIIVTSDDDDIFMPNHLNNIKKYWKEDTNILHWENGIYYNYPNITSLTFLGNSGMVYSRKAWEEIGKSPIMNAGGDTVLRDRIHSLGENKVVYASPPNEEVSWWYRWALPQMNGNPGCFHQSGIGEDLPNKPNIIQRHSEYIEQQRKRGLIPTGDIYLSPHYNHDYSLLLKNYNNK